MACVFVHKKIRAYRSILAYVGSSMKSVSIHTFERVCDGSVVQSGRTLVSKTKCQRFKSFRGRQVFGGVAQLGERLVCNQNVAGSIPVTSTMYGEREALVTSGDCKSSTLGYTGFESLAFHQITVDVVSCQLYYSIIIYSTEPERGAWAGLLIRG